MSVVGTLNVRVSVELGTAEGKMWGAEEKEKKKRRSLLFFFCKSFFFLWNAKKRKEGEFF